MKLEQDPHPYYPDTKIPEDVDDLVFLWESDTLTPSDR
jgi:hypothetical protein